MQIEHIVITTDLSEEALRPYAAIADIARAGGARVTLLHVVDEGASIPQGAAFAPPVASADVGARVDAAREAISRHGIDFRGLPVHAEVVTGGNVAETIARYARERGADLIAVSTHGRSGFRRLFLGSVAEELLRKATVPVLVFPRVQD